MPRPPFTVFLIDPHTIQIAAGISLESVHCRFGANLSFHNYVNMIRSNVSRQKIPFATQTNLTQSIEYNRPALMIEAIWHLVHLLAFYRDTLRLASANRLPGTL
jgi:hypothetical protein